MSKSLETFVTQAEKTSAFDWASLIAAIMAMIQQFIDGCANSQEQWVGIVSEPGPFRRARLLWHVRGIVRRDGKTAPRDRGSLAYAIVDDLSAAAVEDEAVVAAIYDEAKGA